MIYSMTGYAVNQHEWPQGTLSVELRAVNHRYLDVNLRMPEECRPLENTIREKIAHKLARGKVECRINLNLQEGASTGGLQINRHLIEDLQRVSREIQSIVIPDPEPLKTVDYLRWPGVLVGHTLSAEEVQTTALALLDASLEEFMANRAREGDKLAELLLDRASKMEALVAEVRPRMPQIVADYEAKLNARLVEAIGSADDERIRQEVVLFAQKIDVAEELDRLTAHITELRHILKKGGSIGKRLDFLMQELNREANTLGSKSVVVENSRVSMELKVLIEQMREQVQNIE